MAEQLLMRFRGICAHIDLPNGNRSDGSKKKRAVLVRHQESNGPIESHVPYISFFTDDIQGTPTISTIIKYSRPGTDGQLGRIELPPGTEIRLKGLEPGYVTEEVGYRNDVPHMSEIVGEAKATVAEALRVKDANNVDPKRASAVIDMPAGRLCAGEPEAQVTRFDESVGFRERRLARWSDLYTEYTPPLTIQLVKLGTAEILGEITFNQNLRMLTIGNEPKRLIVGAFVPGANGHATNGHGDHNHATPSSTKPLQQTGHFIMYYNVLENEPVERPIPIPAQLDGSGCPPNNYP